MPTYRWNGSQFVDKRTGEPMQVRDENAICKPYVCSDIPEYISPVSLKPITSRSHRREDLKRHDCVEVDPPKTRRPLTNPRFAAKHRLPFTEADQHASEAKAKRDKAKMEKRLNAVRSE